MTTPFPLRIAGESVKTATLLDVLNPFTQETAFQVNLAGPKELDRAVTSTQGALAKTRELAAYERYEILHQIIKGLESRKEELAQTIRQEAGKPISLARGEVERAMITFSLAADWVRNWKGEVLPLGLAEKHRGKMGVVKHFPIGVVLAITPFNFPLNLVAHKVAPAIAAGCPIIVKPALQTPTVALILADIIAQTDWPQGALSVVPCTNEHAQTLVEDDRIAKLSFTGSPAVGWKLKSLAGRKRVTLELGGDAAALIDSSADLQAAAQKCANAAFTYAGQVCISVQRMHIHHTVYNRFRDAFLAAAQQIQSGDTENEAVTVGPMIDVKNQQRARQWIAEAQSGGASLLLGSGRAVENVMAPVVLERLPSNVRLAKDEAFAPVVYLDKVQDMQTAFQKVNASRYGLQTGIFTDSQTVIKQAFNELNVGGVIVNNPPMYRVDNMPYGGIKDSGFGREGLEYAIHEMMESKILVW